jgi:hypothetical protein
MQLILYLVSYRWLVIEAAYIILDCIMFLYFLILSSVLVTIDGVRFVIGFIDHLQVGTTCNYNTVMDFHITNDSKLIFSVYFHWFSLSVSGNGSIMQEL